MGTICGKMIGMFRKEFPSGLFYHVAWQGLSVLKQGGVSCLLGLGGPPRAAFGVVPPIGMLSMGSGKGCHLLGLGDCLGAGEGGSCSWLFFHGRSLLWQDEWRQQRHLPQ